MKRIGIFGLRQAAPSPTARGRCRAPCYALVTEELARGWMSLAGAIGGHSVVATLLSRFGTAEQREALAATSTGEVRAAMALTEPGGGSDLQAMLTTARHEGDEYFLNGAQPGSLTRGVRR